jgi:hypothetical protein
MPALVPVTRSNTPTHYVNRRNNNNNNLLDEVVRACWNNSESSLSNDDLLGTAILLEAEKEEAARPSTLPDNKQTSSRPSSRSSCTSCSSISSHSDILHSDCPSFSSSNQTLSSMSSRSNDSWSGPMLSLTRMSNMTTTTRRSSTTNHADLDFKNQGSNSSLIYPLPKGISHVQDRRKFMLEKRMTSLRKLFYTLGTCKCVFIISLFITINLLTELTNGCTRPS